MKRSGTGPSLSKYFFILFGAKTNPHMRKLNLALLFILASFILFSCQKEVSSEPGSQTGGSGSTTSYYPTKAGSWWKFKDSASGSISTSTIVDRTKTINNILYSGMTSDISADTGWISSAQPNYYIYGKGVSPNTGASYDILFHFLNDTASVGYNWQYLAGQGNGFTAYIHTTIAERNINMTVAGKSYGNVIHTRLVWSYDVFGSLMEAMAYDYFIAKGVGIIKVRSEGLTILSGFKACTDLIDYSIK
jgi:hypothetical protein